MRLAILFLLCGTAVASAAEGQDYTGICEPSGGAFVDATHFAVASDEANVLWIYARGTPEIQRRIPLRSFLGHKKSDIEAAALGNGVIYWTASQSNKQAKNDKKKNKAEELDEKRKVVFKTKIQSDGAGPTLEPVGIVREDLKADLVRLSGSKSETIDVEGLAATPNGGLLFGLRNLVDGKAAVLHLTNADAVLADAATRPIFGETARLDLEGRGIRSLERVGNRYLIVAGKPGDAPTVGYALYWWDGTPGHPAKPWDKQPDFSNFDPEVAMPLPDGSAIQIISDDGRRCIKVENEDPPSSKRGFQSRDVPF